MSKLFDDILCSLGYHNDKYICHSLDYPQDISELTMQTHCVNCKKTLVKSIITKQYNAIMKIKGL